MERLKERVAHIGQYAVTLLKWMVLGGVIGLVGGIIGSLFHIGVDTATQVRLAHSWVLYLMPVGGLAIVGLYRLTKTEGKGTNDIIASVHFGEQVPGLLVPVIFVSTVITHLCGGSAGREGAALQIGGGIGYQAGRLLRLGEKDLPLATLCGMSGVFAALFGTPLTATVFALEVISVGVLYYAGLVPCLTAALTGYLVSVLMGVPPTRFTVTVPGLEVRTMLLVMVLALLCAVVSILFCRGLHGVERLLKRTLKNPYLRVAVGAAVLIGLTLLTNGDYNGAGMEVIGRAIAGQADPWAWVWKLLFTAITCIVLGMGLPTTAAYVIAASILAPSLIKLGLAPLTAHLFVFYFACLSAITPPVALAAYAGAGIAKTNPMTTAVEACKLGFAGFMVPFAFCYNPAMMMQGSVGEIISVAISAIIGVAIMSAGFQGWLLWKLNWLERIVFIAGGLLMFIPGTLTDITGLAIAVALLLVNVKKWEKGPKFIMDKHKAKQEQK